MTSRQRIGLAFWILIAVIVVAVLIFALRGSWL